MPGHSLGNLDEWLVASRGSTEIRGWRHIVTIRERPDRDRNDFNPVVDHLPIEFSSVSISAISVSSSITVVIAGFSVVERNQSFLTSIFRAEHKPRIVLRDGRRRVESGDTSKEVAICNERERLIATASDWLRSHLRGSFAASRERRHPALSLLLTRVALPVPTDEIPASYLRALEITSAIERWRCREFPGLTLHQQRDSLWLPNNGDRCTLAGQFDEILPDALFVSYRGERTVPRIIQTLEEYAIYNVITTLAIDTLLRSYEVANARTRDVARKTHRRRLVAGSRYLRNSLLTSSIDVNSFAVDVGDENNHLSLSLRHNILKFDAFGVHRELREESALPTSLWDDMFSKQVKKAKVLQEADSQLRSILSTVASLNSTIASALLQRIAIAITLTSLIVAVLAVLISNKVIDLAGLQKDYSAVCVGNSR